MTTTRKGFRSFVFVGLLLAIVLFPFGQPVRGSAEIVSGPLQASHPNTGFGQVIYLPFSSRSVQLMDPPPPSPSPTPPPPAPTPPPPGQAPAAPRVDVPYFDGDIQYGQTAIFWFGQVTSASNYADVRLGYNASELWVTLNIFDRNLWYSTTPTPSDLANWDAVTLYLNQNGNTGSLGSNAYAFESQLNWWEARDAYQAAYQGSGSDWALASIPYTTSTGWRSYGSPNDNAVDDSGWTITYHLPFQSLGLAAAPAQGTTWGLGVALHDRDSAEGPTFHQVWPESMDHAVPSTWGQLYFGIPTYTPPASNPAGAVTIRQGLDGAVVTDGAVGGGTTCGNGLDFWTQWGITPQPSSDQNAIVNVQNQSDVADWPCYSKFYITFPLSSLPAGKVIRSAQVTLYQIGSAGGGSYGTPGPSYVQVMTENANIDSASLTWNNAPQAQENISGLWVPALPDFPGWPGVARTWDISRAVAQAYAAGQPLRLVFYSSDTQYHSGRYFISSEVGDWDAAGRPTLQVELGNP